MYTTCISICNDTERIENFDTEDTEKKGRATFMVLFKTKFFEDHFKK